MIFVDTNYFIRFLIGDVENQKVKAAELFRKGVVERVYLFSSTVVFFEIFWVFTSFYEKSKKEVSKILQDVLSMSYVDFAEREVLMESVSLYKGSSLELEDCYNVVYAEKRGVDGLASFDEKLVSYLGKRMNEQA